ncbi:MAG: hypothetical protein R3D98_13755 [Candidatus Krumholzibacteriia bacterium]
MDGVVERLGLHGLQLARLTGPVDLEVDGWRLEERAHGKEAALRGAPSGHLPGGPRARTAAFPAGTWVVDTAQPAVRAAVHLLEPEGPDALLRQASTPCSPGRNTVEDYVIERLMAEMAASDPALLRDSLDARAADPQFAADPGAIRDWFYRRTPYYDSRASAPSGGCDPQP